MEIGMCGICGQPHHSGPCEFMETKMGLPIAENSCATVDEEEPQPSPGRQSGDGLKLLRDSKLRTAQLKYLNLQLAKGIQAVRRTIAERGFDVYIIFSKTAPFTPQEVQNCRAAQPKGGGFRVIMLSDRELEPNFIYEKTAQEFEIVQYGGSFENMARTTQDVFFAPNASKIRHMTSYKIECFDGTMHFSGTTVVEMSGVFKMVLSANGVEHKLDVPAKITAASDIFEKRLEVYAPPLPKGIRIRADELQAALSGYFFAFLNDDESLKDYRNHGQFS